MSTVQQIINSVDRNFPNQETTANKIIDLDRIHKRIYELIIRKKNTTVSFTDYTIADQYTYTLPSNCKPENIVRIVVSSDITGSIDDNTIWQEYEYADRGRDIDTGYYWGKLTDTTYILVKDGLAIDTANYEIRITYFKSPITITAVTDIPDLDSEFHDLLEFALTQELASKGDNPAIGIANYYEAKYQERFNEIFSMMREKNDVIPVGNEIWESRW